MENIYKKSEKKAGATPPPIGYELLGSTAIIEHSGTILEQKEMGLKLIRSNNRIKTVLAKAGPVQGRFRIRKLRYLCGDRKWVVKYKENGCEFVFDPRRTFFSSKLSFERSRIINNSSNNESVIVMFAGVGPFAIEIAKTHKGSHVVAIEENPYAYRRMKDNIRLNKLKNVEALEGDVAKKWKLYKDRFDRVIMPLPWSSIDFLDAAFNVSKRKSIIHIYIFGDASSIVADSWKRIKEHAHSCNFKVKLLFNRTVRTYSAKEIEVVLDIELKKPGK